MSAARNILQIPLGELVDVRIVKGPTAIKSEEGLLVAYVYVDFSGRDFGGYVNEAKARVADLKIPEGYRLTWSGEYENLVRTHEKLKLVIPLTLLIIVILIYFNTKSAIENGDRAPGRSLFPRRLLLVPLPAQLQHEHRRLGGDHRARRSRRGDGGRHAPLPRPGLRRSG